MKFNTIRGVNSQVAQPDTVSLTNTSCMCLVQRFLGSHSFLNPLNYAFTLTPPPLIFPLLNQCDRCLVLLAWGLMAGRCRFTSHGGGGGGTLSRGWLCQKWKPLTKANPDTHLN